MGLFVLFAPSGGVVTEQSRSAAIPLHLHFVSFNDYQEMKFPTACDELGINRD
jgi:hypothetical protein